MRPTSSPGIMPSRVTRTVAELAMRHGTRAKSAAAADAARNISPETLRAMQSEEAASAMADEPALYAHCVPCGKLFCDHLRRNESFTIDLEGLLN